MERFENWSPEKLLTACSVLYVQVGIIILFLSLSISLSLYSPHISVLSASIFFYFLSFFLCFLFASILSLYLYSLYLRSIYLSVLCSSTFCLSLYNYVPLLSVFLSITMPVYCQLTKFYLNFLSPKNSLEWDKILRKGSVHCKKTEFVSRNYCFCRFFRRQWREFVLIFILFYVLFHIC